MVVENLQHAHLLTGGQVVLHAVDLPQPAGVGVFEPASGLGPLAWLRDDLPVLDQDPVHRRPGRERIEPEALEPPGDALRPVVPARIVELLPGSEHRLAQHRRGSGRAGSIMLNYNVPEYGLT